MKRCLVCLHSFERGVSCPRCGTKETTFIPKFVGLSESTDVKVMHECFELDEVLGLHAFKATSGEWLVNVNTWVAGLNQYCVVSVPISIFKKLVTEVEIKMTNEN